MSTMKKLSQLLVEKGLITEPQMAEALEQQKQDGRFLGAILLERGWVGSAPLMELVAEHYRMPFLRLEETPADPGVIARVPVKVALHYQVMPLKIQNSTLTVAISNPQDVRTLDELRLALQQKYTLEPVLATPEDILRAIREGYGVGADTISRILTDRGASPLPAGGAPEEKLEDIAELASDASVVKLVNQLLLEAHNRRATDVHLEPYRGKVRLRYRVDGILHDAEAPPAIRQLFPAIISRIKVLSNLNIVERRLPQDGRASVKVGDQKLDLRISVLPTPQGESVVIRILPSQMLLDLKDLGFAKEDMKLLDSVIRKPYGLVFVTGPTGSGKTTTLYAMLKAINSVDRKIITMEDPIEYELEGMSQVQVNPAIGLTFAAGLRSMLRHDPNVMMVGEVRDVETAELAIRIALTGHMVLSTLHTNDATGGVARLMDMGIDPFLVVSSLECIIAQRLVRLLCPACKEPGSMGGGKGCRAKGCRQCSNTGFRGRSAIYELFLLSQPLRELILKKASADALRRAAVEMGMKTMREDGLQKVEQGVTTLDEVLRVTQDDK
ncbi:MAG: type II/IV secretion system protein [Candidatus Omnitrophica bacterium]|nr:type II/IV secretion system protein [Candidatus Omnitrophota bacterium]